MLTGPSQCSQSVSIGILTYVGDLPDFKRMRNDSTRSRQFRRVGMDMENEGS